MILAGLVVLGVTGQVSGLARDEEVMFFPSVGWPTADGRGWELEIRGWVFEREQREAAVLLFRHFARRQAGLERDPRADALCAARARPFLYDNERGKSVAIRLGAQTYVLPPSAPGGMVSATIRVSRAEVEAATRGSGDAGVIVYRTVGREEDAPSDAGDAEPRAGRRRGSLREAQVSEGRIYLLSPDGLSVVSDIDDTIRITGVRDRREMIRSTFFRPFRPVPGMAEVYRGWAARGGAVFHYVSGSPWQLYQPLSGFFDEAGFPAGSVHLREFRWTPGGLSRFLDAPAGYKRAVLRTLLERVPRRRFVLVGDSGETDPEFYGELARRFPKQVVRILIRDTTGEPADAARFRRAFEGLPAARWKVFVDPAEISDALPPES